MRKILGWTLAIFGVVLIAGLVGGCFFLRSASFERLAIRTIVRNTDEASGGRAEIGHLDFRLSTLTAHLYDVTVYGTEPSGQPALLRLDKLTVGLKIQSLLRRKISLSELLIEHPVVYVRVGRNGESNIPNPPQSTSTSHTSVFDLAAQHVLVTKGEIHYNDAKTPLEAELYGLRTEVRFDPAATRYRGSISYDDGHVRYAGHTPFPNSLDASFSATPSQFSLESAVLKVGSSAMSLHADVTNYDNPTVDGSYELRLHTQDLAAMSQPVTPAGDVSLSGTIHYSNQNPEPGPSNPGPRNPKLQSPRPQNPWLRNLRIDGEIASNALVVRSADGRLDMRKLRGQYHLTRGSLRADDLRFETLGGEVSWNVEVQNLDTTAEGRLQTRVKAISLQAAQETIRVRGENPQRVRVVSRVDGTAVASWTGSFGNLRTSADLVLKSPASSGAVFSSKSAPNRIPVDGVIHASYDGRQNTISFRETSLRVPSATITLQGQASNHSDLQVQANTTDLHQVAMLISALAGEQTPPADIRGSASVLATVRGSIQKPELSGQATAQNLEVQGSRWSNAALQFQASPSQVVLKNATLVNAHQGKASFSGSVQLRNWSYQASDPAVINLTVQRLAVVDIQRLANLHYPVSGDLSAEISFSGSELNPAGSGNARIDNARAYGENVQHLVASFRGDKNSLNSTFRLSIPAGSANGGVSFTPATKAYSLEVKIPSIALQKLQLVQAKNLGVSGTLTASASGQGTLDNPQLTATLALPQLQLRDKSISQVNAAIRIANQRADLSLDSQYAQASVRGRGFVNLNGDYYAEAAIDTTSVSLDPLLRMFVARLPQVFQGETELHATLRGPLKDKAQIEAHLTIPTLRASYQSLEIGTASPIRADYANDVLTLQPAEIRGTDTSLRVQGSIPFGGNTAASLAAQGSVDVRILRIFEPDVQSSGTLAFNIHAGGSAENPVVQGQVHVQDVGFSTPDVPLGVEKLNGTLNLNDKMVQISSLAGEVGGGQMSLGGTISYRPNLQFNVTMQSKEVRLLYPDGLRTTLDGNLVLSGTKEASVLNGRVLIDSLSFTPDFDLSKFSNGIGGNSVPAEPGPADNVQLAINVQSKGDLSASSSQVSLEGQVNLQVTGTAANPVIVGRTNLTSGELFYRNVRYQLQRGIVTFDNPNQTEPMLNVSVTTTVEQYDLTLSLRGRFDNLTTSYTSDPPLATADIINLIARGTTTQEQNAASQSTDSIIAGQVASQATTSLQQLAGISSLQIDPLLGGNNQNPSARVAVQQRVSKNFLFTFSTDLSQPGTEVVQGDYQLNKRWSVSVTRDEVGGVSVGGKYHTSF